jgi:hypothetical protein
VHRADVGESQSQSTGDILQAVPKCSVEGGAARARLAISYPDVFDLRRKGVSSLWAPLHGGGDSNADITAIKLEALRSAAAIVPQRRSFLSVRIFLRIRLRR